RAKKAGNGRPTAEKLDSGARSFRIVKSSSAHLLGRKAYRVCGEYFSSLLATGRTFEFSLDNKC
ncbi:hypothetical protein, partial [Cupriavidus sp. YAF13]|uniref:hypothetical protein n=1 Tax=Cupriavidus sp. YAF13 TaxID=3233075 RepID=UPI003F91A039